MKKTLKFICLLLALCLVCPLLCLYPLAGEEQTEEVQKVENDSVLELDCLSAVLMEQSTGKILYQKDKDVPLPPASVTKIMTLLLIFEEIDRGNIKSDDKIQVSENAASMGGSQVFLEPGEIMTVDDLLKSVIVSSANDAAVALAENIAGSVESFVSRMNARAAELGMNNSHFENVTGLDDGTVNHVLSAGDIAIMSRELLKHEKIFDYTTIWMDTIRDGQFGLTNTNRLIRFYSGANGLKTGSTSKAKFCISATAKRDNMQLIAVIMGSPTRDVRNECAKKLLDYGFANYSVANYPAEAGENVKVLSGVKNEVTTKINGNSFLVGKGLDKKIERQTVYPESVKAPVKEGEKIGEAVYTLNGELLGKNEIIAAETVEKITFFGLLAKLFGKYLNF